MLNKHVEVDVCYLTSLYIVVIEYDLMSYLSLLAMMPITATISGSFTSHIEVVLPTLHDLQVKLSRRVREPCFYKKINLLILVLKFVFNTTYNK